MHSKSPVHFTGSFIISVTNWGQKKPSHGTSKLFITYPCYLRYQCSRFPISTVSATEWQYAIPTTQNTIIYGLKSIQLIGPGGRFWPFTFKKDYIGLYIV